MTKSSRAAKAHPQAEAGQLAVVSIGETELGIIECNGQRAVTLGQVDAVHKRPKGTARKRFNDNRARLIEGEDFAKMSASEFRTRFPGAISRRATGDVTLVFETGYLMLVKSFGDDLAWKVQRELVTAYFRHQQPEPAPAEKAHYSVGRRDSLTLEQGDKLRDTLHDAAHRLPLDEQGEFLCRGWSKLKSHFHLAKRQTYRDIQRHHFTNALSIVQRHVVEYEPPVKVETISYTPPNVIDALVAASNALAQTVPVLAELASREPANDPHRAGRRLV